MPREILVDWTTANGAGKVSVFYFIEATAVTSQRSALATFLGAADGVMASDTTWTIRTVGREMLTASGALTGAWSDPTAFTGTGAAAGESWADASQALVRWSTDHIVGSRFLQGRTFLPGLTSAQITDGNLGSGARTTIQTAATALVNAGVQLCVWHRPVAGVGGEAWAVDTATVQSEIAVLRRRRG